MHARLFFHSGLFPLKSPVGASNRLLYRLAAIVLIGSILLAGCAPQQVPVTSSLKPTSATTSVPTLALTAASTITVTQAAAPTSIPATSTPASGMTSGTPSPTLQTYSVKPDDQTQARLRIGNCVYLGKSVNIYINGKQTKNGDQPFWVKNFDFSGYLYLPPGQVQVAVTPYGLGVDQAMFAPMNVTLEAGHRYTLAILGQVEDKQNNTLFIDETKAMQSVRSSADQYVATYINNIKGLAAFDHIIDGKTSLSAVPFGGYKPSLIPSAPIHTDIITVSGAPDKVIDPGGPTIGPNEVNVDSTFCYSGKYPGYMQADYDVAQSAEFTGLSALDYLKQFTDRNKALNDPTASFNTFLSLVQAAGMADELNNSPHLVLAPTDQAFAQFATKAQLDALTADPKAAEALLKEHLIDGYFPYGALSGGGGGITDRTLTNMAGHSVALFGDPLKINGSTVDLGNSNEGVLFTANGTRLIPISMVLQVK